MTLNDAMSPAPSSLEKPQTSHRKKSDGKPVFENTGRRSMQETPANTERLVIQLDTSKNIIGGGPCPLVTNNSLESMPTNT